MDHRSRVPIPLFERLQIESQSNCNRSCWFCPRTFDRSGKYLDGMGQSVLKRMPTSTILDLLDQAQAMGFAGPVGFYHYSEPLLDDRHLRLAQEAKTRGMKPELHTNGDLLRLDTQLCRAVQNAYDFVVVGLYDYSTEEELEEEKRFWQTRLEGVNLEFSPIGQSGSHSTQSIGVPRALVPPDSRMLVPDLTFGNAPCHRPLIRMLIQYDGTMCHCCEDTVGDFDLGNVYDHSLEELWYAEKHVEAVNNLIGGRRESYSLCRRCPQAPTGPAPPGKTIEMALRTFDFTIKNSVKHT